MPEVKDLFNEHATKIIGTLILSLLVWLVNQTNTNQQEVLLIKQTLVRQEIFNQKVEETRFTDKDGERLKLEVEAMLSKCNCRQ